MKILVCPDSFKSSLAAFVAAQAIETGLRRVLPDAQIVRLPVADGGEGTAETLAVATGGRLRAVRVVGPLGKPVNARWAVLGDGETAVVELAEAAGLTQIPKRQRDPKITTTLGVGELMQAAMAHPGVKQVIVALGGSATNDGGAGLLSAFGVRFFNEAGEDLPVGGAALSQLAYIEKSAVRLPEPLPRILIACDVDNPLTGERGVSAVFGPQKGATPEDVHLLDAALTVYAGIIGYDIANRPGAGAAGGTCAGLLYLFPDAELRPGIEIVLDANGFDTQLANADLVITGEGRMDSQTLSGKAAAGVAKRAKTRGVPVVALVGGIGADVTGAELAAAGIDVALPLAPGPVTLSDAKRKASRYLADAAERAARLFLLGQGYRAKTV